MAAFMAHSAATLRPHVKVHKCSRVAQMQLEAGATGVTCATIREAITMANGGVTDLLVANEFLSEEKLEVLARLVGIGADIAITVDNPAQIVALAAAAARHGVVFGVLVELDVGMGRCGVDSAVDAFELAANVSGQRGLTYRGIQGYEGHCMTVRTAMVRRHCAEEANSRLVDAADYLASRGCPPEVVSAGGTGTYAVTAGNDGITEVQAGSYALMDTFHGGITEGEFEYALSVAGTVVSRRGRQIVIDCGLRSVDGALPVLWDHPEGQVRFYGEEHTVVEFPGAPSPKIGQVVEVIPGYTASTLRLYDEFLVTEGDVITGVWPIFE
jgi:3-hydroxy-D-aspartate aldolase